MDTTKQNMVMFSVAILESTSGVLQGYFKYLVRTPIVVSSSYILNIVQNMRSESDQFHTDKQMILDFC